MKHEHKGGCCGKHHGNEAHEHHSHHGHHEHKGGCCGKHHVTEAEKHFLSHLIEAKFLPITQFVIKSSKEHSFEVVALSPVFIESENATMERVKELGRILLKLEKLGLIDLDFDIPLSNFNYDVYEKSELFEFFKKTVEDGCKQDGFLGDLATLECGSIAPTEKCIEKFS